MIVKKFGGSSLADADKIRKTVEIVQNSKDKPVCLVLSAMKGVTNYLVEAASWAEVGDDRYKENIAAISEKHVRCMDDLFGESVPEELKTMMDSLFLDLN